MASSIDSLILTNLIMDVEYNRKVIPHLMEEYFHSNTDKIIFNEIKDFIEKYNTTPTKEALAIQIQSKKGINAGDFKESIEFINNIDKDYEKQDFNWLVKTTEKFCKDKAVFNGVMDAISIIDGEDKKRTQDAIPGILTDALAVSFDSNIGHDYFADSESRYDKYSEDLKRLPFDIDILNKITRGGLPPKTLTLFLGGTGTGKTNIKCHCATAHIKMGKNVLYITNEMSEEKIGERIDANMLNVELDKLESMGREAFTTRLHKLSSKTNGKLIIKEYPMHSAHSGHFKALIEELRIKKNFIPDVVYIDYLGICASARYKSSTGINTNTYYGSVAEELRALGQFYNIPVVSSIQTNRSGSTNSDLGLTDIADSFSIAMAADLVIGIVTNDELAALNQMLFVILKNRHNDVNYYKKFLLGVDRAKMRLYNLDDSVSRVPDIQPITSQVKQSDKKRDFSGFDI
jgi:replicative DNA helicase